MTEIPHAISTDALCERGRLDRADAGPAGTRVGGLYGVHGGADEGRRSERQKSPAAEFGCDDRAHHGRQVAGAGRPLRRLERAGRRLLPHRRSRPRRRPPVGRRLPGGKSRCRRGAPDLGDVSAERSLAMHLSQSTQMEGDERARSTADAVARRSYGKLVAFLAARTRDVAAAEDALADAFTSALADW